MNIQKLYTFLGLALFLSINQIYADPTKTYEDYSLFKSQPTEQKTFDDLLTAIEEEDLEIIDTCLNQYPLHLHYLFNRELFLYPSNSAERQTYIINPLTLAIALGKPHSIKKLIEHGAQYNQLIQGRLPFTFITNIPEKETRYEIAKLLLETGAIGHTPTDLKKCIKLFETMCQDKQIVKYPQKIITHPLFQDAIEILQKNPYVLFYTSTNKIQKDQDLNTVFTATQVENLLKTAILLDSPWLASFFITLKKKFLPNSNGVNEKISEHFNLIDYLLHHYNEEILDIFLQEKPLISDYFMFDSEDLEYKNIELYYDLYVSKNPNKTDFLENLSNPCLSKKLLLTPYYSEKTKTFALESLEPETEKTLLDLFKTLENEQELLDINEQIETVKTLLKNIKNPAHLNIKQITTEYCLTNTGYTKIESYDTLLNLAINEQNLFLITLLVEAGADVNQSLTDHTNHAQLYPITTLYYAAVEGTPEIISYLLDKGAIITPLLKKDMESFNEENKTFLGEYINKKDETEQMQKALIEPVSHKRNREVDAPTLLSPATKRIREN